MFKSVNPYNLSVIAEFPLPDDASLQRKLDLASAAFTSWKKTAFSERASLMGNLSGILRANKEEYARIITLEMGKAISESRAEVEKCATACDYFAQHAESFLKDYPIATEARKSFVAWQPIGAVLAIMPWNFPFWQVFRFAAPAVMAGNVALLKHAPNVCQTSLSIESIFRQAGFPDGVFQSLIIDVDKVESIINSNVVQAVTLTGSEYAGSQVAALAGRHIKKTVLELGGSDPFIVLPDADFTKAAKTATLSRMLNAGQSCIAAKRFIVLEKAKDDFMHAFRQNIAALRLGNPLEAATTTGPVARLDLAEKLESQMNASVKAGATLIEGGERNGCRFTPALLDGVKPGMPAFDEETFGPLAAVITVKTEQQAIKYANSTRYGLGASIWTRDMEKAGVLASQIEAGCVFVNTLVKSDVRLPFGGVKKSGYGRELSEIGLKEFVNAKTIVIDS